MTEGKILPYLDIPFQHASPEILKAMKRPAAQDKTLARIKKWREECPELTLRSTFIVGFPGETDSDFAYLLDWLEEAEIDRVGCFKYEPVAGASSNAIGNAVPDEIKQERWNALMARQQKISARRLKRKVGTRQQVIIDEVGPTVSKGRSKADAPADRRRGLSLKPPSAARRRDRHRENRTRRSIRSARQRRRVLTCSRLDTPLIDIAGRSAVWPRHELHPDPTPRQLSVVARSTMMGRAVSDDNAELASSATFSRRPHPQSAAFSRFGRLFNPTTRSLDMTNATHPFDALMDITRAPAGRIRPRRRLLSVGRQRQALSRFHAGLGRQLPRPLAACVAEALAAQAKLLLTPSPAFYNAPEPEAGKGAGRAQLLRSGILCQFRRGGQRRRDQARAQIRRAAPERRA